MPYCDLKGCNNHLDYNGFCSIKCCKKAIDLEGGDSVGCDIALEYNKNPQKK